MKRFLLLAGLGLILTTLAVSWLAGCVALDKAVQPGPHGEPSLVQTIGTAISPLPWGGLIGTALGLFGTVYSAMRARKHAQALGSVVAGVQEIKTTASKSGGQIALDVALGLLESYQNNAGTRDTVRSVLAKVKGAPQPPPA